jgi:uncharacterized protein (DUF1330 family)
VTAYVFGIREKMHDPEAYERYTEAAMPTLEGRNSDFLAAYGRHRVLEGEDAEGAFVLAFDTFEQAEAWFDSPEYTEATKLREGAADYRVVLVEGVR